MPIQLEVNGIRRRIDADPQTPLLLVLRNDLDLTAAKLGCGLEQCGACAVLLDGEAVLSCTLPVGSAGGRAVVTPEGLGSPERLHPVQQAFVEEQAAQCGYCIPGMVVAVTALLDRSPAPDDDEVRAALDRHLCRCGSHPRILRAVARAVRELAAERTPVA